MNSQNTAIAYVALAQQILPHNAETCELIFSPFKRIYKLLFSFVILPFDWPSSFKQYQQF